MKRFFPPSLFFLILGISLPVGVLFGQDEVDCNPYKHVQYRPDLQIYRATYPTTRMSLIPARKLANLSMNIGIMIEDKAPLEIVDQAIQEILSNDNFFPYNHSKALSFYLKDLLPPMIEDYEPSNRERIGYYIDYLMKEEGLGIDLIAKALPLLQGYWSDARIDSVASVAHAAASKMLTLYEEGGYPPPARKEHANSGKYERDWACVSMLYRPFLDDLASFMED